MIIKSESHFNFNIIFLSIGFISAAALFCKSKNVADTVVGI